ncbi:unnamed protein product [Alopecurus aequalis]
MAPFPDWSSLPADLTNRIAECFLATSDLDYYTDFRGVCRSWRSDTEDPKNSPHPRFRPRQWVMIDRPGGSNSYLFVNTTTGRFLRKEIPLLRDYCIGSVTPDGLLVLLVIRSPHISVLNPFTGNFIQFTAPPPDETIQSAALVGESSPKVYTADLDSESFTMYKDRQACPLIRLTARGIYTNGELGPVAAPFPAAVAQRIFDMMRFFNADGDAAAETSDDEDTGMMSDEEAMLKLWIGFGNRCFLLESAGEMLIIIKREESVEVYRMDTGTYQVERATDIGNRAIFLCGSCRCMSVDADKFPSVDANCIYYTKSIEYETIDYIYVYDLEYQTEERVSEEFTRGSPQTIIQLLSSYDLQ